MLFNYILNLNWTELLKYYDVCLFMFSSSLFYLFMLFAICIFNIALKYSFSYSILIGSYSVELLLIDISLLKYKINPLRIDSEILLPFTNSL